MNDALSSEMAKSRFRIAERRQKFNEKVKKVEKVRRRRRRRGVEEAVQ